MKRTNTVNAPRALDIKGQPHQLSYITAEEAEVLKTRGGSGKPGPMGIPSFFIDDDDEEAELSEAITGSYTPAGQPGGQAQGFTFDDGGDNGVNYTLGKSNPYGGTEIQGNVIRGGTIFGRTQSQLDRQQRLAGMGDYRNSQQYKDYLTATGRSLQNPYGNTGLFSGIFGANRVNYNMDPGQAQNILDIGFDRYMNFDQQTPEAQRRGFGKLFGGPEGEMTAQGEIREQIQPMSTSDMAARLVGAAGGLGAPLAMLPGRNVGYAPMGSSGYDPQLDPQVNPDLKSGPFSLLTGGVNISEALDRAKNFVTSKLSPAEELAAQTRTQARGPELSQTVSGGRFEDESARPQVMTPDQEFLTFDGGMQDSLRQSQQGPQRTVTAEQQRLMDEISQGMDAVGLDSESRTNFLNTIISQDLEGGAVYNSAGVPVISYTPERAVNPDTGEIFGDDDRAADYQIAAARLKEMEDFNAAPTYPQSQNFGKRQLDPINPLTVDFLNDINLGQLADIVGKVQSGDLLSKQTPFGTFSIEPEFDGVTPVGAMLRLKGTF